MARQGLRSRFHRSLALAKTSWSVLRSDHSLALFPVVSFIASTVVLGMMSLLGYLTIGKVTNAAGATEYSVNVASVVIAVVGYVGLAYVQVYFLAALVASANDVLEGRTTTLGQGMKIASSRAGRLLPWAILQATVSWILRSLEERAGIIGTFAAAIVGAAWSIVTFLAVPIIVFEDVGPINALKRSGTLLKRTWGENIIGQFGLGIILLPPFLLSIGLVALGVVSGTALVAIPLILLAVLVMIVASVLYNAIMGIYRTALYRYAQDGVVPGAFAGMDLEHAFAPKGEGPRTYRAT